MDYDRHEDALAFPFVIVGDIFGFSRWRVLHTSCHFGLTKFIYVVVHSCLHILVYVARFGGG